MTKSAAGWGREQRPAALGGPQGPTASVRLWRYFIVDARSG